MKLSLSLKNSLTVVCVGLSLFAAGCDDGNQNQVQNQTQGGGSTGGGGNGGAGGGTGGTGGGTGAATLSQNDPLVTRLGNLPSIMGLRVDVFTQNEVAVLRANSSQSYVSAGFAVVAAKEKSLLAKAAPFANSPYTDILNTAKANGWVSDTLSKKQAELVIGARKVWMEMHLDEGSYLWIRGYDQVPGIANLIALAGIHDSDGLRSPSTTRMIDNAWKAFLEKEHTNNANGQFKKAVILGGGPNGLLAGLKLYAAGMNVEILEQREGEYSRPQILRLDPKWVAQLKYYWGNDMHWRFHSKISRATEGGQDYTRILALPQIAEIPTQKLEATFQNRYKFLEKGNTNLDPLLIQSEDGGLKIRHVTEFESVEAPKNGLGFSVKAQKLKVGADGKVIVDNKGKKVKDGPAFNIEADLVVFAGGANDKFRTHYLSPAYSISESRMFGIALWDKTVPSGAPWNLKSRDNFITNCAQTDLTNESGAIDTLVTKAQGLINKYPGQIENFDITKFNALGSQVVKAHPNGLDIRTFENNEKVYIGSEMPTAIGELVGAVRHAMEPYGKKDGPKKDPAIFKDFKTLEAEINEGWASVLKRVFTNNSSNLAFDAKASSIFPVSQRVVDRPVVIYQIGGYQTVLVGIGDGIAIPHYFSGSGLSGGRKTSDDLYDAVMAYRLNQDNDIFLDTLFNNHVETQKFTRKRGAPYLKGLNPTEVSLAREQATNELLGATGKMASNYTVGSVYYTTDLSGITVVPGAGDIQLSSTLTGPKDFPAIEDIRMMLQEGVTVLGNIRER